MNIRCPFCGDRISVETEWQGRAYLQERVPIGFECDNWKNCAATWDIEGDVTNAPQES
jgi:sarcosine oxidase delta subunit